MGWFDSLGIHSVDEAAVKLAPLADNAESRLREIAHEVADRFDGATFELEITEGKIVVTIHLSPRSPPAVK